MPAKKNREKPKTEKKIVHGRCAKKKAKHDGRNILQIHRTRKKFPTLLPQKSNDPSLTRAWIHMISIISVLHAWFICLFMHLHFRCNVTLQTPMKMMISGSPCEIIAQRFPGFTNIALTQSCTLTCNPRSGGLGGVMAFRAAELVIDSTSKIDMNHKGTYRNKTKYEINRNKRVCDKKAYAPY